jgi:hypothetical protein
MKKRIATFSLSLVVLVILVGCTIPGLGGSVGDQTGQDQASALPRAPVVFTLVPPAGTAPDAKVSLDVLDTVTGVSYNASSHPMNLMNDGRWQVQVDLPIGAVVNYRYWRTAPSPAFEATGSGQQVRYRVALIPGPTAIDDLAATWTDQTYAGQLGRILGKITDASSGIPLTQIRVTAGGITTFTDGQGQFRLEGLAPGLHTLVAASTDGSYLPKSQGAVVAADSSTPADLSLEPATPVQATFEVTVPEGTAQGAPIRVAGNLLQFGDVFSELPGGLDTTSSRMPTLVPVDATHYLLLAQLYSGSYVRYKYTLGDGLWNAERDSQGAFLVREMIVPDHDFTVQDTVGSWHGGGRSPITFQVSVPSDTPSGDEVNIQLNPFTWFEPLPMWKSGENQWLFVLEGPLDFSGQVGYRYCRNFQCGGADDAETPGPQSTGRPLDAGSVQGPIDDQVAGWQWLGDDTAASVAAPQIEARSDYKVGVDLAPDYQQNRSRYRDQTVADVKGLSANSLTMTPSWVLQSNSPLPVMSFDPAHGPFDQDLKAMAAEAKRQGLGVVVRPTLMVPGGSMSTWWSAASRDSAWWSVWFEGYRAFVLTYARLAESIGADSLVIGGPEAAPSLPDGLLANGSPSGAPGDSESRWRSLIDDVRGVYSGKIVFEIEDGAQLQTPPPFMDSVDGVRVYWHVPLGDSGDLDLASMQAAASTALDSLVATPALTGLPIELSVEYLSIDGGATACAPRPDGSCRDSSEFDDGAIVDPDLPVDLTEQAQAMNAVLLEAAKRPAVRGFYARRYNPAVTLQDKSASVHGKPAHDVLWYWYQRLTGQSSGN